MMAKFANGCVCGVGLNSLSMMSLFFNFLNAHVLGILDKDHRRWRDFVKVHAMKKLEKRNKKRLFGGRW